MLARILTEKKLLGTNVGLMTISAAAVDDICAWYHNNFLTIFYSFFQGFASISSFDNKRWKSFNSTLCSFMCCCVCNIAFGSSENYHTKGFFYINSIFR